jgi:hypothetical protein
VRRHDGQNMCIAATSNACQPNSFDNVQLIMNHDSRSEKGSYCFASDLIDVEWTSDIEDTR